MQPADTKAMERFAPGGGTSTETPSDGRVLSFKWERAAYQKLGQEAACRLIDSILTGSELPRNTEAVWKRAKEEIGDGHDQSDVIARAAKATGGPDEKAIKAGLKEHRSAILNERKWGTIEKEIVYKSAGGSLAMRSVMAPQSQVQRSFADLNGGGVNCHMAKAYEHCTNVAVTSATIGDPSADGLTLFKGIRHGVMSAYELTPESVKAMGKGDLDTLKRELLCKDAGGQANGRTLEDLKKHSPERLASELRAAAADRRAVDVIKTALVSDHGKLTSALNGGAVTVKLNSVSLLTPSALSAKLASGNEGAMWDDQSGALSRLASKGSVTMTVADDQGKEHEVTIKVEARSFNFGVNAFTFLPLGVGAGWSKMADQNKEAMTGLGTAVMDWRESNKGSPQMKTVDKLLNQIQNIYHSDAYKKKGNDPYQLVSRISLLSHMIGEDTCFNCKSGKDRTGYLDAATKDLAMRIHRNGGAVPELGSTPDADDKENFYSLLLEGGNHQMQTYNTGVPGYKLDIGESLQNRFASAPPPGEKSDELMNLLGLSHLTKS